MVLLSLFYMRTQRYRMEMGSPREHTESWDLNLELPSSKAASSQQRVGCMPELQCPPTGQPPRWTMVTAETGR